MAIMLDEIKFRNNYIATKNELSDEEREKIEKHVVKRQEVIKAAMDAVSRTIQELFTLAAELMRLDEDKIREKKKNNRYFEQIYSDEYCA